MTAHFGQFKKYQIRFKARRSSYAFLSWKNLDPGSFSFRAFYSIIFCWSWKKDIWKNIFQLNITFWPIRMMNLKNKDSFLANISIINVIKNMKAYFKVFLNLICGILYVFKHVELILQLQNTSLIRMKFNNQVY